MLLIQRKPQDQTRRDVRANQILRTASTNTPTTAPIASDNNACKFSHHATKASLNLPPSAPFPSCQSREGRPPAAVAGGRRDVPQDPSSPELFSSLDNYSHHSCLFTSPQKYFLPHSKEGRKEGRREGRDAHGGSGT